MWLLNKISCEIQILNEKVWKLMIENGKLEEENKNLRDYADNLDSENDNQAIEIEELKKENKKLKDDLLHYIRREEEYRKEIDKLKSDLSECECSMHFENDEVWFWKRECKKHKPCLIKEEYVFNLWDYDYMILTSTTPQLKIIKKNNKWDSTFTVR